MSKNERKRKKQRRRKYGPIDSDDNEDNSDSNDRYTPEASEESDSESDSPLSCSDNDELDDDDVQVIGTGNYQTNRIKKKKKKIVHKLSSSSEEEDNRIGRSLKNKRKKQNQIIISESSDSDSDGVEKDNNENNNIDEDEDEIQFIEAVPAERSTISRRDYRIKATIDTSSNTESSVEDGEISSDDLEDMQLCSDIDSPDSADPAIIDDIDDIVLDSYSPEVITPQPELPTEDKPSEPKAVCAPLPVSQPTIPTKPSAPEPQLPSNPMTMIMVNTPTYHQKLPYQITLYKNGQPMIISPPNPLPPQVLIRVFDPAFTIDEIKKRLNNDSDEIEAIEQTIKVSLICPISSLRVVTPCRSTQCNHFDCFDINSFLDINYNKKIEDWKCPKCKQSAHLKLLFIDSLMDHILKHQAIDSSVDSVIFDKKAVWVPDTKANEKVVSKSTESGVIDVDDTVEDIIELDDDDDEPIPSTSVPPVAQKQTVTQSNQSILSQNKKINPKNNDPRTARNQLPPNQVINVTAVDPRLRTGVRAVQNQNKGQQYQQNVNQTSRTNNPNVTEMVTNNRNFIPLTIPRVSSRPNTTNAAPNVTIIRSSNQSNQSNASRNSSQLPAQVAKALGNSNNDISFEFCNTGLRSAFCNKCKANLDLQNVGTHMNQHRIRPTTQTQTAAAPQPAKTNQTNRIQSNPNQNQNSSANRVIPPRHTAPPVAVAQNPSTIHQNPAVRPFQNQFGQYSNPNSNRWISVNIPQQQFQPNPNQFYPQFQNNFYVNAPYNQQMMPNVMPNQPPPPAHQVYNQPTVNPSNPNNQYQAHQNPQNSFYYPNY